MSKEDLQKLIKDQHVLFDTNVLIEALGRTDAFKDLFEFLRASECAAVHFGLIEFEFTRNSFRPSEISKKEQFFKKIASLKLPLRPELFDEALKIAQIYAHNNVKKGQISLVDCCIAAYLKQYAKRLFLVTFNHKDFPRILFDRLYMYPIDAGDDVLTAAFYQFNDRKWKILQTKFLKVR